MRKRLVIVLTLVVLLPRLSIAAPPTTDPVGDAALAERFTQMAQNNLATRAIGDTTLREAAALLEAACKLDNTDPRFAHLRAEACLSLRDMDGALEALKLAASLDGNDQVAQVQIIDLYAAKMESADQKINYYNGLLGSAQVAAEVKAHVGARLAKDMLDRGALSDAKEAIANALKLNPLDPDALELNEQATRSAPGREHVAALLALLRGNPAQPIVAARLATELAEEGLTNEAATWYSNSVQLGGRLGIATDPGIFLSYVEELMIGNQVKGVDAAVDSLLQKDPNNAEGLYLKMMLARRGDDKDAATKALDATRDGFLERLYVGYRDAMKGTDPPTTQPNGTLAERMGDVVAQAKQVKQSGNEDAIAQYAAALTDLAWLEIYFQQTPANATTVMAALHELVADDDVRFARLEGWSQLVAGKPDEAKVKLSAVSDRDPLSAMGLLKIAASDPKQKDEVKSSAQTLVNDNRAGLLAVMLLDGLRDQGASVQVSAAGNDIKKDLENFPKDWFVFLDNPGAFYTVSCMPAHVSHAFDEPMMAKVQILNLGQYDISIGPKGALKPDLWFDVNVRGPQGAPQNLTGAAYDRLARRLVLKVGQVAEQWVRLDQPKIAQGLAANPIVSYQLLFQLVTNPVTGSAGVAPGPGGQRTPVKKPIERMANPMNAPRLAMLQNNLNTRTSDVRMMSISLLAAYAQSMAASKDDKVVAQGKQLADVLGQMGSDPSGPVSSWARFLQVSMLPPEKRAESIKQMIASEYWPQRMLAVATLLGMGPDGKEMLKPLTEDAEPAVKKFATAALDDLEHPTTQPTSAPAEAPTTAPSGQPVAPAPASSQPGGGFRL